MNFLEKIKTSFTLLLEWLGLAWWVEVATYNPCCIYYFGPFIRYREAEFYQSGYIEDLKQENAEILVVEIKQCQPKKLTIDGEEALEILDKRGMPLRIYFTQAHS